MSPDPVEVMVGELDNGRLRTIFTASDEFIARAMALLKETEDKENTKEKKNAS